MGGLCNDMFMMMERYEQLDIECRMRYLGMIWHCIALLFHRKYSLDYGWD